MPRAMKLEMAPNIRVKHVVAKPNAWLGGQALLLNQAMGCSVAFILKCSLNGTEEAGNAVTSMAGVVVFDEAYREQTAKLNTSVCWKAKQDQKMNKI